MDIKKLAALTLTIPFAACTATPVKPAPEEVLFNNIALAICMGSIADNGTSKTDFNRTAMSYFERSNLSPDSLERIRELSSQWLKKSYPSKHGGQINNAKCIDMLNSQDLQRLYQKETPCSSVDSWLSKDDFNKSCIAK